MQSTVNRHRFLFPAKCDFMQALQPNRFLSPINDSCGMRKVCISDIKRSYGVVKLFSYFDHRFVTLKSIQNSGLISATERQLKNDKTGYLRKKKKT